MGYGETIEDKKCGTCGEFFIKTIEDWRLLAGTLEYRDGEHHHRACLEQAGAENIRKAQARALEVMQRYGFSPLA